VKFYDKKDNFLVAMINIWQKGMMEIVFLFTFGIKILISNLLKFRLIDLWEIKWFD